MVVYVRINILNSKKKVIFLRIIINDTKVIIELLHT